jgi:hypothetical protein
LVGITGANDGSEQTLDQILTEMDGFEPNQAVVVLGAANRPEIPDPALLRPGRFDRRAPVQPPDHAPELFTGEHVYSWRASPRSPTAYVAMRIAVGDVSLLGCRMFTWSLGCACSCEPELPSHQPHVVMEEGRVHTHVELGPRSTRPPSRQREFEAPTARRLGLGAGAETSRAAGREDGLATWRLEAAAILNSSHAPGNLICVRASPCGGRK